MRSRNSISKRETRAAVWSASVRVFSVSLSLSRSLPARAADLPVSSWWVRRGEGRVAEAAAGQLEAG